MPKSTLHGILHNRIYTGDFEWLGKKHRGTHEPLVTYEMWERVQGILDGRGASKVRESSHAFAFSGLITCGHCDCTMVAEIKKRKYIYYHCTGCKGKCGEPYTREEVLEEKFKAVLERLRIDESIFQHLTTALKDSSVDEKRAHAEAMKRLEKTRASLQQRLDTLYIDKVDGEVSGEFYHRMHTRWGGELEQCLRDMERHQVADQSYMGEGVELLRLATKAHRKFETLPSNRKSRLLNLLLSNCSWSHGELHAEFRQPFDLIAEATAQAAKRKAAGEVSNGLSEIWLPGPDSNQRPSG